MSVANTMKRGLLIACSVWYFKNIVSPLNALGMAMILAGVSLYSRALQTEVPQPVAPRVAAAANATLRPADEGGGVDDKGELVRVGAGAGANKLRRHR